MNDKITYEDLCKFITDNLNCIFLEKQFPNLRFVGMSTSPNHYREWRFTTSENEWVFYRLKLKARFKPDEEDSSDKDIIEFLNAKPLSLYLGDVSGDIRCIDFELDKCHTHMYIDYPLIKTKYGAQFSKLIETLYCHAWKWCCDKRCDKQNEENSTKDVDEMHPTIRKIIDVIESSIRDHFPGAGNVKYFKHDISHYVWKFGNIQILLHQIYDGDPATKMAGSELNIPYASIYISEDHVEESIINKFSVLPIYSRVQLRKINIYEDADKNPKTRVVEFDNTTYVYEAIREMVHTMTSRLRKSLIQTVDENNEKPDEALNKTNAADSSDPINNKSILDKWDKKDDEALRDMFRYCVQNSYPEKLVMINIRNIRIRNMITTIFASYADKYFHECDFNYAWESSEDGFGYKIINSSNNDKLLWCNIINNVALITYLDINSIKSIDSYYIPLVVIDFNQKLIDVTTQSVLKFISKDGICHSPIYREIIYKILVNIRMLKVNEMNSIKEKNAMNEKKIENASVEITSGNDDTKVEDQILDDASENMAVSSTPADTESVDGTTTNDESDAPAVSKYNTNLPEIKEVIYSDAATTVIWSDGSKTVSKVKTNKVPNGTNKDGTVKFKKVLDETFDPEVGLAMCIAKKYYNNTRNQFCKDVYKFKELSDERCSKKAATKKKSEKNTSSATAKKTTSRTSKKTTSRTSVKTTSTTKKTTTRKKSNK